MRSNKLFLLTACTFNILLGGITLSHGAGLIAETSSMLMRRTTYSTLCQYAWKQLPLHSASHASTRFVSTAIKSSHIKAHHEFAKATTDISFKQLLDPSKDKEVIISFLNTFVPQFALDKVTDIEPASVVIPALPRKADRKEKATFMDLHVKSKSGASYLIEMQARRHIYFDERALFYLCNTYGRQLSEAQMKSHDWYRSLKPTIALQVLDYDSNRIQGIIDDKVEDTQVERVKNHPLAKGDYVKHYYMTDSHSKQKFDHIQMIQVELPRYIKRPLFPPQKDFTPVEWWLSVLRHSSEYSKKYIDNLSSKGIIMPDVVNSAFKRLDFSKWNPDQRREYALQVEDREEFEATYAVERAEGFKEGEAKGEKSAKVDIACRMISRGKSPTEIQEDTGLTAAEIKELTEKLKELK